MLDQKKEATRADIKAILPKGCTFKINRVDFSDLARDYAYAITILWDGHKIPGTFFSNEQLAKWKPVIDARKRIVEEFRWRGKRILP